MKSIKQQYIDLREGNMSQANFMRNIRMSLPQYVTNVTSFDDSIRILKNKGILTEADIKNDDKISKYEEYTYTLNGKVVHPEIAFYNNILKAEVDGELYRIGEPVNGKVELSPIKGKTGTYTESYYDSDPTDGDRDFDMEQRMQAEDLYDKGEKAYLEGDLLKAENYYQAALKAGGWLGWSEKELPPYGSNESINETISDDDIMKKYNEMFAKNPQTKFADVAKALNIPEDQVASALQSGAMPKFGLKEAKENSSEGKWKTVTGKDLYAHFREIDNLNSQEVLIGIDYEIEKNPELTKLEAQKIVIKNLKKNPIYYTSEDISGVEGYEPEYLGGKSADPKAHQMKSVKGNDMVDKARGMKPVKDVEKVKKDSDKGGEANKVVKNIELMSLIAKTVRGLQKMDATGEKMKKIAIKEGEYSFTGDFVGTEVEDLKTILPDAKINTEEEPGQKYTTTVTSEKYNDKSVEHAVKQAKGEIKSAPSMSTGEVTAKFLTKEDTFKARLKELIRKELKEITGAYSGDAMSALNENLTIVKIEPGKDTGFAFGALGAGYKVTLSDGSIVDTNEDELLDRYREIRDGRKTTEQLNDILVGKEWENWD